MGNADPLDAFRFGCGLVLVGIERRVSRDQARRTSQSILRRELSYAWCEGRA
jgi:hypothetical protein